MVGLQGRKSPLINTLARMVNDGRIGRILSSTIVANIDNFDSTVPIKYKHFSDQSLGGNNLTIHFGHCKLFLPSHVLSMELN